MAIQTVADMMSGFAGATVAEIGYGHRIESFDDESFKLGEKSGKIVGEGATPILLDVHPICEYPEVGLRAGVSNCKADEFVQSRVCPHELLTHALLIFFKVGEPHTARRTYLSTIHVVPDARNRSMCPTMLTAYFFSRR